MSSVRPALCFARLKEKLNKFLPFIFLALLALSRWPGLFPPGFSVVYAVVFCAGVYLTGRTAWWLPLVVILATDVALNFYWDSPENNVWAWKNIVYLLCNYVVYAGIIGLGRCFKPGSSFFSLFGGGILGALLFYIVTNTVSWAFNPYGNPEYEKTFWGWMIALIKGTGGWPDAWLFFRSTLMSGALFTALFVGAMKLTADAESPADKRAGVRDEEGEAEAEPEEAKARGVLRVASSN